MLKIVLSCKQVGFMYCTSKMQCCYMYMYMYMYRHTDMLRGKSFHMYIIQNAASVFFMHTYMYMYMYM